MKTVAVIPIKLNSERLPNKNIKTFSNGVPLCKYIFNILLKTKEIDEIYVYCSSEKIKEYMPAKIKFLRRDTSLDRNEATMNDVLNSFVNEIDADIYVLTHVTSPFLNYKDFDECIRKIKNNEYDSAFSVRRVQDFLWKDGSALNYNLKNIPRTQDLPCIYKETCGFYIFKDEVIKKLNRRIGNKPYFCEVSEAEAIDINNAFDFEIADYLCGKVGRKYE